MIDSDQVLLSFLASNLTLLGYYFTTFRLCWLMWLDLKEYIIGVAELQRNTLDKLKLIQLQIAVKLKAVQEFNQKHLHDEETIATA